MTQQLKKIRNLKKFFFSKKNLNQHGMTLIEIMIVLLILGTLTAVLATNVMGKLRSANVKNAKILIKNVSNQIDMYYSDCNSYPSNEQGLRALVEAPADCKNWGPEPYMKNIPKDPWGSELIYQTNGSTYTLKSLGRDKKEGGTSDDADISSNDL